MEILIVYLNWYILLFVFVDIPENLDFDSAFDSEDFRFAVDLVRFIREEFGDYFTICVAGN